MVLKEPYKAGFIFAVEPDNRITLLFVVNIKMYDYFYNRNYFRLTDGSINHEFQESYIRMTVGYQNDKDYQKFLQSELGKHVQEKFYLYYDCDEKYKVAKIWIQIITHGHKTKRKTTYWFDKYYDLDMGLYHWTKVEEAEREYEKLPEYVKELEKNVREQYVYAAYLALDKSVRFQPAEHMIEAAVCFIDQEHVPFYCGIETVRAVDTVEKGKWQDIERVKIRKSLEVEVRKEVKEEVEKEFMEEINRLKAEIEKLKS